MFLRLRVSQCYVWELVFLPLVVSFGGLVSVMYGGWFSYVCGLISVTFGGWSVLRLRVSFFTFKG